MKANTGWKACATMGDNIRMPPEGENVRQGNGDPRAVLIVEDSENSAATLEIAFLGIPGLSVLLASSALEALRILRRPGLPVRAVVTDLNMPRMDGFEMIRRIREDQCLSSTPIIVVSADTDPETPGRVAQLGVSAFFPKPYSPAQVRRKLEQILDGTTQ
ncbi:Response regulator receiver protein [Candidatus Sulfopaludibacter sp. SbA4]|nr:Response regulator receiver protein [Candidatus Sulfopaludibacter sp. SbA4]